MSDIPWLIHIILLSCVPFAFGGFYVGLNAGQKLSAGTSLEIIPPLIIFGNINACFTAGLMTLAPATAVGCEIGGVVLCLNLTLGFLGVGLSIGQRIRK